MSPLIDVDINSAAPAMSIAAPSKFGKMSKHESFGVHILTG